MRMTDRERINKYGPANDEELYLATIADLTTVLKNVHSDSMEDGCDCHRGMAISTTISMGEGVLKEADFELAWYYWGF